MKEPEHGRAYRRRGKKSWPIVIDIKDGAGCRKRKWHSFKGTFKQAQTERTALLAALDRGTYVEPSKLTVGEYLDQWVRSIKPNVSTRTYERYEGLVRVNLKPLLGGHALRKLQTAEIQQAYADAHQGGLSGMTIRHMHGALRQALGQAVEDRIIAANRCTTIKAKHRPKVTRRPPAVIYADEAAKLVEAARERDLHIPFLLGVLCGIRLGEIVARRWRAVDLDRG